MFFCCFFFFKNFFLDGMLNDPTHFGESLPRQWEWINCGPVSKGPRVLKVGGGGGGIWHGVLRRRPICRLGFREVRVNGWWNYSWQGCW